MNYYEIIKQLNSGKTVKYLSSRYHVVKDASGILYRQDIKSGFREMLSPSEYDDCFI